MLDSNIPLQVQSPAPVSPIASVGQLMGIRDMASQVALRNAQTQHALQQSQETEQKAEERRRDIADQNQYMQSLRDPAIAGRIHTGDFTDLETKIHPRNLDIIRQKQIEYMKGLNTNTTEQNQIRKDALGEVNSAVTGLKTFRGPDGTLDLEKVNNALPSTIQNLTSAGVFKRAGIDPSQLPSQIKDPSQLDIFQGVTGGALAAYEKDLANRKIQAETQSATATAGLHTAQTSGAEAESEREKLSLKMMKDAIANPQSGAGLIDQAIPASMDPNLNQSYKAAWNAAMSSGGKNAVENAANVVKAAADHASQISMKINPIVRQGEALTAAAKANAEVPAHVSAAVQTAQATAPIHMAIALAQAKAMRQGDNPAFAGVAPSAVPHVLDQSLKFDGAYIKAKASADSIQAVLDLAGSGNKAAGANVPLIGVGAVNAINGIKRINSAEIAQYGTAGSLLDKIQGKLQGWTEGQPIPADVLKDMKTLHSTLAAEPWQVYTQSLQSLNDRSGSTLKPAFEPPSVSHTPSAAPPLPARLSKSDIGKSFLNKDGKSITITNVNPSDPTQFRFK